MSSSSTSPIQQNKQAVSAGLIVTRRAFIAYVRTRLAERYGPEEALAHLQSPFGSQLEDARARRAERRGAEPVVDLFDTLELANLTNLVEKEFDVLVPADAIPAPRTEKLRKGLLEHLRRKFRIVTDSRHGDAHDADFDMEYDEAHNVLLAAKKLLETFALTEAARSLSEGIAKLTHGPASLRAASSVGTESAEAVDSRANSAAVVVASSPQSSGSSRKTAIVAGAALAVIGIAALALALALGKDRATEAAGAAGTDRTTSTASTSMPSAVPSEVASPSAPQPPLAPSIRAPSSCCGGSCDIDGEVRDAYFSKDAACVPQSNGQFKCACLSGRPRVPVTCRAPLSDYERVASAATGGPDKPRKWSLRIADPGWTKLEFEAHKKEKICLRLYGEAKWECVDVTHVRKPLESPATRSWKVGALSRLGPSVLESDKAATGNGGITDKGAQLHIEGKTGKYLNAEPFESKLLCNGMIVELPAPVGSLRVLVFLDDE